MHARYVAELKQQRNSVKFDYLHFFVFGWSFYRVIAAGLCNMKLNPAVLRSLVLYRGKYINHSPSLFGFMKLLI